MYITCKSHDMIFRNAFGCNTATYELILLPVKGDLKRAAESDYVSHKRSPNRKMSSILSYTPTKLMEAERAFKRACDEILSLNRKIEDLSKRFDKARKENRRSYRYNLRLQIAVVEGVRNMFYEYASKKADEISELRFQVTVEMSDDEDDYGIRDYSFTALTDEESSDHSDEHDDNDEDVDEEMDIQ